MAVKDKGEILDWTTELEVQLFYAMKGHKPVGVNRHFQMALVHDRFNNSINKEVSSSQLWDHLCTMYDMEALNESEIIPFPNKNIDFSLPESDFREIMDSETKSVEAASNEVKASGKVSNSTPKSSSSTKSSSAAPKISNSASKASSSTPKLSNSTPKGSNSSSKDAKSDSKPKISHSHSKQSSAGSSSDTPELPKRKGRPPKHKVDDSKPASPAGSGAKRKR